MLLIALFLEYRALNAYAMFLELYVFYASEEEGATRKRSLDDASAWFNKMKKTELFLFELFLISGPRRYDMLRVLRYNIYIYMYIYIFLDKFQQIASEIRI